MKSISWVLAILVLGCSSNLGGAQQEWIPLFDGQTLTGWRAAENPSTFRVEDGQVVVAGPRAHLFYEGPVAGARFRDFELSADVMTQPGSNSGIFIHTEFQPSGWPTRGYEIQVNNSHTDWRRTGSVYAVDDVREAAAADGQWFNMRIAVRGRRIQVSVDGRSVVDFTEPDSVASRLTGGTIALQGHDPESLVRYRDIRVRVLDP